MTGPVIKKISSWLSEHTTGALISFCRNLGYWARRGRRKWKNTKNQMALLRAHVVNVDRAAKVMADFKWRGENTDWTPWTITAVHQYISERYDDCDGAAVLWCWLFKCAGMKADLWHLRGDRAGHAVAVTRDGRYMGTNAELYEFKDPDNWKSELLDECWGGKYEYMFR